MRVRGPGGFEPHEPEMVERIYRRCLDGDPGSWPDLFSSRLTDPSWALWTVVPRSGLAASFPKFASNGVRWHHHEDAAAALAETDEDQAERPDGGPSR